MSSATLGSSYRKQRQLLTLGFLIVPLGLLGTFTFLPLATMTGYSFQNWSGLGADRQWVGFDHYIRLFTDPEYFAVFGVSLYYLVGTFVQIGLALFFATLLSFKIVGRQFFKGVLFFPFLLNSVAVGFIFLFFFRPDGTLDTVLGALGLEGQIRFWLRDPSINNISLAFTSVWRYMGFNFILFLGAIQSVPPSMYEAAELDGANRWQQFRFIIYPSIKRIVQLNVILGVRGAIAVFEIPYIMTLGNNGTETFVIQTVDTAFKFQRFGLASAMAIVLFLIIIAISLVQRRLFATESAA